MSLNFIFEHIYGVWSILFYLTLQEVFSSSNYIAHMLYMFLFSISGSVKFRSFYMTQTTITIRQAINKGPVAKAKLKLRRLSVRRKTEMFYKK